MNAFHQNLETNEKKACTTVKPPLPHTTVEWCLLDATEQRAVGHKEREEGWCAKSVCH